MIREELTEKILDIKREKGWTWKHITDEIGGMSPVLVIGALLGQHKLVKPLAKKAAALFGLTAAEEAMLNEVPYRGTGTSMPPTDPLIYRFYELCWSTARPGRRSSRRSSATASCRPSTSTWSSSASRTRAATA